MDACCLVTLGYVEVSDDAETRLTEKGLALYEGTVRWLNKTCTGQIDTCTILPLRYWWRSPTPLMSRSRLSTRSPARPRGARGPRGGERTTHLLRWHCGKTGDPTREALGVITVQASRPASCPFGLETTGWQTRPDGSTSFPGRSRTQCAMTTTIGNEAEITGA